MAGQSVIKIRNFIVDLINKCISTRFELLQKRLMSDLLCLSEVEISYNKVWSKNVC